MISVSHRLLSLRAEGEKALIAFFTAGDQPLAELPQIVGALEEAGVDVIEIGIPFSDPFGEGPVIQASSQRSLDTGTTPEAILEALGGIRARVPLVTMGYYNPVLRIGLDRFAQASAQAGVSGTIISDLVPDEAGPWSEASQRAGIETIFLVAPTTPPARIEEVASLATGFVYVVSRTGVTGAENAVPDDVAALVNRVRSHTSKPVCVGFGISRPEHVQMVCQVADGAVVGSFLVDLLHREWNHGAGRDQIVAALKELKRATQVAPPRPAKGS